MEATAGQNVVNSVVAQLGVQIQAVATRIGEVEKNLKAELTTVKADVGTVRTDLKTVRESVGALNSLWTKSPGVRRAMHPV